jgi:ATP adenylyltransferase/5',5'''-P-1,P-4-tetraphosphate phosphorylase II
MPDTNDNISFLTEQLFAQQTSSWQLAATNYKGLEKTLVRELNIGGAHIIIQFNPERILSSVAEIDEKSISKRKCFLCPQNLPAEQQGIPIYGDFLILVNPYPVFQKHLTIAKMQHTKQSIAQNIGTMLDLSATLTDYIVFYNGPRCGASAPDHLHFQAGNKGFLPVEKDFAEMKNRLQIAKYKSVEISFAADYLRRMISLQSNSKNDLLEAFAKIYDTLSTLQPHEQEPMLNILCYADNDSWIMHIFPRTKHRPTQCSATDANKFQISPASVEFGGVFITPRDKDFQKLTTEDIIDIFDQITTDKTDFEKIIHEINQIK